MGVDEVDKSEIGFKTLKDDEESEPNVLDRLKEEQSINRPNISGKYCNVDSLGHEDQDAKRFEEAIQMIDDIFETSQDFPAVARAKKRTVWQKFKDKFSREK